MTNLQSIALGKIALSATNPRKIFDKSALTELTESVRQHGVMQPVLVRPHPKANGADFELVAGERRYRAAKAAGLEEIPALVRALTDVQALELQVVENLQRTDLHPLEEAEGYEVLIKKHRYAADDLAAKVGKSKAYVYARLKLCALVPKAREAFYDGKLNPSTALLVARIPVPALQEQAVKEISKGRYGGNEPMSVRDAIHHVHEHYMLRLADAPFPTGDDKLLPRAGACAACPKRTGNQPELFGDVKSGDVCTDPECFAAKKVANIERLRTAAQAKGQTVISGKEAKKIIPYDRVDDASGYIELDVRNYRDSKSRTNRALIGKACPMSILVEHPESGKLVEVVAKKDVAGVLKAKLPSASSSRTSNDDQKKCEAKARLDTSVNVKIFEAIIAKHPGTMTPADAALIAGELLERTEHECVKRILRIWEPEAFEKVKGGTHWELQKRFAKRIPELAPAQLILLMVELALVSDIHVSTWSNSRADRLIATARRLGVDHEAIRRELAGAVKAKAKTKARKTPPKKTAKVKAKRATAGAAA